MKLREPRACFVPSRVLPNGTHYEPVSPEPNWMFSRYLESQLHHKLDWLQRVAAIGGGNAYIVRPNGWEAAVNPHKYTLSQVQGPTAAIITPTLTYHSDGSLAIMPNTKTPSTLTLAGIL